jgi:hypothetical protein
MDILHPAFDLDRRPAHLNQAATTDENRKRIAQIFREFEARRSSLNDWEISFIEGRQKGYVKFGRHMGMTDKQLAAFQRIYEKMFAG